MKRWNRKLFFCLFSAILVFSLFTPLVLAQRNLELEYPQVPGAESPNQVRALPNFIKYLFNFAVAAAALITFGAIAYGGIMYVSSAGNPGTLTEAKSQIMAGFLGLLIILSAYILLTTINPQLVVLKISEPVGLIRQGIILYAGGGGAGTEEGKDFLRVRNSRSNLSAGPGGENFPQVGSIKFLNSSNELEVNLYSQPEYKPQNQPPWTSQGRSIAKDEVVSVGQQTGSIELIWKTPGIYLFSEPNCTGESRLIVGNAAALPDFDNKARSLKIIPTVQKIGDEESVVEKFGAILHENNNFDGDATVFYGGDVAKRLPPPCVSLENKSCNTILAAEPWCKEHVGTGVSSVTIFRQPVLSNLLGGDGVTLFANYDFNRQKPDDRGDPNIHCGPINRSTGGGGLNLSIGFPAWIDGSKKNYSNQTLYGNSDFESKEDCAALFSGTLGKKSLISSIKVDGDYIAVLFWDDGRAEVFGPPGVIRLKDRHIGDNTAKYLLVIPTRPE